MLKLRYKYVQAIDLEIKNKKAKERGEGFIEKTQEEIEKEVDRELESTIKKFD